MRVLIACEYSGKVREAFRALGHDAWSCDLLPSDNLTDYHYTGDCWPVIEGSETYQGIADAMASQWG